VQTHFSLAQLADPKTAEAEAILRRCVHCGFCLATCPTYLELGNELDSPRGRIYLIKDMLENGKPASKEVVTHIDRCLSCLSCVTTCPSGVDYMHLVDQARVRIEKTYKRPLGDRFVRERVVLWNDTTRAAEASNVVRFADLILEQQRVPTNPVDAHASLLAAIRSLGIAQLPWSEAMLAARARIASAREWAPELDLPDVSDDALLESVETWLDPFLSGKTRLEAVTPALLGEALMSRFTHDQRRGIDEIAQIVRRTIRQLPGLVRRLIDADQRRIADLPEHWLLGRECKLL